MLSNLSTILVHLQQMVKKKPRYSSKYEYDSLIYTWKTKSHANQYIYDGYKNNHYKGKNEVFCYLGSVGAHVICKCQICKICKIPSFVVVYESQNSVIRLKVKKSDKYQSSFKKIPNKFC